jgi:diguanylate cyclase (GGDEF)-like protein/PAS domain S-box-containing protein
MGLILTGVLWKRREVRGALPLMLLFLAISIWSVCYAAELISPSYQAKVLWSKLQYLGISWVTVFWLFFCLKYANIHRPQTRTFFLIFSWIPLATFSLALSNEYHHLLWKKLTLNTMYGINMLGLDYGIWFWVNITYSYLLYLAGLYILIQYYFRTPMNLRQQVRLILLAGLFPGIANLIYVSDINPLPLVDLTPFSFVLSGILIVFVLFYHRFLDIIPVARDTTIENMRDGIIVVDLRDRIVDINPAAEKIIHSRFKEVIGKPASQILTDLSDWISISKEDKTPMKVITLGEGKEKQIYLLNLFPLEDSQGNLVGHTIVYHNNTETFQLNKNLKDQADRLEVLYEIGKAITSTLDVDKVLEMIYNQLSRVIPTDAYFVALYLPEQNKLDVRILIDQGMRYPAEIMDASVGLSSLIVNNRKPLLIKDLPRELDTLPVKPILVGGKRLSRSWLGVPMVIENELIGLLAVASYQPDIFTETDQLLLEQIAQQAVLSIQNARNYQEVTRQAKLDSLTGVSNHKHLIEQLYMEAEAALATLTPLSMIMLDIDHFKQYNDTYGHIVGDQVLRLTVQAIQSHIKKTDTVGRWGGEEFGIILPNATVTQANMVANRIRRTLSELPLFNLDGKTIPKPTISQGIASMPEHTSDADELVIIADRALYRAKEKGRDQVAVGKPS